MSKVKEVATELESRALELRANEVRSIFEGMADADANWDGTTTNWLIEIHKDFADVKFRDAFLNLFAHASFQLRINVLAAFSDLLDEYAIMEESDEVQVEATGYMIMVYGCLAYLHAGAIYTEYQDLNDPELEEKMNNLADGVQDIMQEAIDRGCQASLLQLVMRALTHNVPINIFYKSVMNVSFEKCLAGA